MHNIRYRTLQDQMAFHAQYQVQDTSGSGGISCQYQVQDTSGSGGISCQYRVQDTSGSNGISCEVRYRTLQDQMVFHVQCQVQDTSGVAFHVDSD